MLLKKLRKNLDWIIFLIFISIVYLGGWQAEIFGFIQRGVLATGLFNPELDSITKEENVNLDFYVLDVHGEMFHVSALKGKTIFINLWASWCPPCVAEMPGINKLYESMKHRKDVAFIILSMDEEKHKALNFMSKKSYDLPLYFLVSDLPDKFNHQSIPTTFVISAHASIIFQHEGMANYSTDDFRNYLLSH